MKGMLVRVGADLTQDGGSWNGPVDLASREFVYVPIPEGVPVHPGMEKWYSTLTPLLARFGCFLPSHLQARHMHLDPDFDYLTYGDQGERAKQLQHNLQADDLIVFYGGLKDVGGGPRLVYAIIGLFIIDSFVLAANVLPPDQHKNAHSRRVLAPGAMDLIVHGRPEISGRLKRCIPIGEYRDRAYRVRADILEQWGGLSVNNGYLQRSARLPRPLNPQRFLQWMQKQGASLTQANN